MLGGDQHTLQEMRNRIADIHAKIESLSYLINRAMMMTNDSL